MTEEIKEILENIKKQNEWKGVEYFRTPLSNEDADKLLNCITNLQQENERLKEENKSYQEYPFIIIEKNGVICRKNQEIERLNNIINELEKYLENMKMNLRYSGTKWDKDCLIRAEVIKQALDKLKELKESDNNE